MVFPPIVDTGAGQQLGSYGLDPELIADLERQFGFDKPAHERFFMMLVNYLQLDFGVSYFQDRPVIDLVVERMPVSISLGVWSLLIIYSISIPLGIAKAVRDGSKFDVWTSSIIFVGYAIPGFLFAILLIVVFAGGNYLDLFHCVGWCQRIGMSWVDRQDPRLPLAYDAACCGTDDWGIRHVDDADQKLLSRRDQQTVCVNGAGKRIN